MRKSLMLAVLVIGLASAASAESFVCKPVKFSEDGKDVVILECRADTIEFGNVAVSLSTPTAPRMRVTASGTIYSTDMSAIRTAVTSSVRAKVAALTVARDQSIVEREAYLSAQDAERTRIDKAAFLQSVD